MVAPESSSGCCDNCGATLQGPFCAACGQKNRPLNPSIRDLIQELGHELTDLDGRVWKSLARLFLSPGYLTSQYFNGRRAQWLPPIRLYLVISLVYFAISSITGEAGPTVNVTITGTSEEDRVAELQRWGFSSDEQLQTAVREAQATWMPRIMFVLLPIFGALVHLGHRRSGRRYPDNLVLSLHVHTAWFGVFALTGLVAYLLGSDQATYVLGLLALVVAIAYFTLTLRHVFGESLWRATAKGIVICAVYGTVTALATTSVVALSIFTRG